MQQAEGTGSTPAAARARAVRGRDLNRRRVPLIGDTSTSERRSGRRLRALRFLPAALPDVPIWGEEMDSPRGRIDLMRRPPRGGCAVASTVAGHFDKCLGCMACMTACPVGRAVRRLDRGDAPRQSAQRTDRRAAGDRLFRGMVFAVFPHPRRLRVRGVLLWLYLRSGLRGSPPERDPPPAAGEPASDGGADARGGMKELTRALPERVAAGPRRARVGVVAGCVQRVFFPGVNDATLRVLAAEGCEVLVPRGQGCCGALSMHSGGTRSHSSWRGGDRALRAFPGGGNHHQLGRLRLPPQGLRAAVPGRPGVGGPGPCLLGQGEGRARVSGRARGSRAVRHPIRARVAYHDACHLAHGQRIRSQPRMLLRSIPISRWWTSPMASSAAAAPGPTTCSSRRARTRWGNGRLRPCSAPAPSCWPRQTRGARCTSSGCSRRKGTHLRAAHPVEILDASIRGATLPRAGDHPREQGE